MLRQDRDLKKNREKRNVAHMACVVWGGLGVRQEDHPLNLVRKEKKPMILGGKGKSSPKDWGKMSEEETTNQQYGMCLTRMKSLHKDYPKIKLYKRLP